MTSHLLFYLPAGRQVWHVKYRSTSANPLASHLQYPVNGYEN
jgi:hypothetical protein